MPQVGAEYGAATDDDICERPHVAYGFLHRGDRGEDGRVDAALDRMDGIFRLPRMAEADPSLATVAQPLLDRDGARLTCGDLVGGPEHDCEVPDWPRYYGGDLGRYDRFILFGLRLTGDLFFTAQEASEERLRARVLARTGSEASRSEIAQLRLHARNTAFALLDSFVERGHRAFALAALPACAPAGSGYQNPNAAWAEDLDQWDPSLEIDARGRLVDSEVPVDCSASAGWTYRELRDSLWDPHATAYRALVLADGYQQLRGVMPEQRRKAWLLAIRQTGDALSLPSGYESGNNHGLTQALALLELAHDFAGADDELLPRSVTDAWLDLGRHRLNDLLVDTVLPDGVQVEQSPFYHNYQLGLLLLARDWLERAGIDLSENIDPRYSSGPAQVPPAARRDYDAVAPAPADPDVSHLNPSSRLSADEVTDGMVSAAIQLALPDGWIPMIGSSLPQHFSGYDAPAFDLYLKRDDTLARQLRYYRSAGAAGDPPPADERLSVFGDSGFVVLRSAFAPDFTGQTHVVFQAGTPRHRHAHADALSIHLFGPDEQPDAPSGRPLLIDPGWFSYRATGRHYFESTLAHNTVNVDGSNQCLEDPSSKRQNPYLEAPLIACAELGGGVAPGSSDEAPPGRAELGLSARGHAGSTEWLFQSARHGLYAGVTHRRGVLLVGPELLVVFDDLTSTAPHTFSQTWHLPPDIPEPASVGLAEPPGYHLTFARGVTDPLPLFSLHEAGSEPAVRLALHRGEPPVGGVPGFGWYSTAEEQREPSAVVEFVQAQTSRAVFASVFLLGELAAQSADVRWQTSAPGQLDLSIVMEGGQLDLAVQGLGRGAPAESFRLLVNGTPPPARD